MKTWYKVTAAARANEPAEISIHDEIGAWGISAKDFLADLARIPADTPITLSLHSPGGEVFDGLAIYNALKVRNVTVRIQGLAASMGSVIAMAGKRIEMPKNAFLMIHNPSGLAYGESGDMRELADLLDKLKVSLVSTYVSRTGLTVDEVSALMDAETWLNGDEAKAKGFIDAVTDSVALSAKAFQGTGPMNKARRTPAALFDISPPPTPSASTSTPMKPIFALLTLLAIPHKGDETEDQLTDLIKNHKPAPAKTVLDLEDAETKKLFDKAVADSVATATAGLNTEVTNLKALLANGAAGAAGAGSAVPGAGAGGGNKSKDEQIKDLQDQMAATKDPGEKGRIANQIRELRKAS